MTVASTWIRLSPVGDAPGGSFGASPATTPANPYKPTSTVGAATITKSPYNTKPARATKAYGSPGEPSRLTVSAHGR